MTYASAVSARLLDTDGSTVVSGDPLANAFDHSFIDELSAGPGSGSVSINLTEPGALQLVPGRFVQFLIDGTPCFTIQIEGDPEYRQVQRGEEFDEVLTVNGRGWASVFDQAIVYPEVDLGLNLDAPERLFSFASPSFPNAGGWAVAEELYEYLDGVAEGIRVQGIYGEVYPAPVSFPWPTSPNVYDPDSPPGASYVPTYWIWPTGEDLSIGFAFFRRTLTLASNQFVTLAITADNYFTLFLEGVPIVGENEDHLIWLGYKEVTLFLPAGSYQIGVVVENVPGPPVNPAGLIMNAFVPDGNSLPATHLLSTDDAWPCVFSDEFWPGWTIGQIVDKLIDEAVARGALTAYDSSTFGALVDTDGNSWDSTDDATTTLYVPSFAVDVGSTVLQALIDLYENGWMDWHVRPDALTLDIWAGDTVGSTPGVAFVVGDDVTVGNIRSLERGSTAIYANSLLVQWEQGYVVVSDATEIAAYGSKVEDIYSTAAASEDDATRLGRIELDRRIASGFAAIMMEIEPRDASECPYDGFTLGDFVTIPGLGGGTEDVKVLSISVETDDEGNAQWTLELNRRWMNVERQDKDLLREIGGRSGYKQGVVR